MNRKPPLRQLALFPAELPTWEALPKERQQDLQDVLALLLEQSLPRQTCQPTRDLEEQTENMHV